MIERKTEEERVGKCEKRIRQEKDRKYRVRKGKREGQRMNVCGRK